MACRYSRPEATWHIVPLREEGAEEGTAYFGVASVNSYQEGTNGRSGVVVEARRRRAPGISRDPHRQAFPPRAFTGPDAVRAMEGHLQAKGEVVGIYTQNPDAAKTLGVK